MISQAPDKYGHGENFEVMLTTDLEFEEVVGGTSKESYDCLVIGKPFEKIDKKLFEENLKRFEDTNPIAFQQLKDKLKTKLADGQPKEIITALENILPHEVLEHVHKIFNEPHNRTREDDGLED